MTLVGLISSCWKPFKMRCSISLLIVLIGISAVTSSTEIFYPYGQGLDTLVANSADADDGIEPIEFRISLPVFGNLYTSVNLENNGILSFGNSVMEYQPQILPIPIWEPFLAPYWSDVDITKTGYIYYRQIYESDPSLLQQATAELKTHFKLYKFSAKWMLVATWDRVPFHGNKSVKSNTFQAVLISDEKLTFLMYNYGSMEWPFLKNGVQEGPEALAGLNNDVGGYQLPKSLTVNITQVNATSNVNLTGRWAFNIDTSVIQFSDTFIGKYKNRRSSHFTTFLCILMSKGILYTILLAGVLSMY
ncbi:sushi, nidogen and EGF-like domain-containing protein 1 isoform X2 [Ranitomeya imitator]